MLYRKYDSPGLAMSDFSRSITKEEEEETRDAESALAKADRLCHLREAVARVKDRQCDSSDRTHDAVEGDKFGLILHEWIAPSSHHLCDSVDASREDGQEGDDHCAGEEFKAHCLSLGRNRCSFLLRESVTLGEVAAEEVKPCQSSKDCKCDDLHDYTGDGDVAPEVQLIRVAVGATGQTSTSSLQAE